MCRRLLPRRADGCAARAGETLFVEAFRRLAAVGSAGNYLDMYGERVMGTREQDAFTYGIEHELTLRLERASDLSERAKRANDAAQHEIDRALEIADELRGVSRESASRAERLRGSPRDR